MNVTEHLINAAYTVAFYGVNYGFWFMVCRIPEIWDWMRGRGYHPDGY